MKNNKGQALIEFVIILPVVIFLLFSFIDLGRILLESNRLENITPIVIDKYKENNEYDDISNYLDSIGYKNINVTVTTKDNIVTFEVKKDINIITPGLRSILNNPYTVKVERTVNNEQ